METSAAKRRKTSPTASATAASTTPPDPPSQQQAAQRDDPQTSPSRSSQRPSFASPTRSSLARHNPEILSRRRDTAPQRPDDIAASEPNRADEDVDVDGALTAQLEGHSERDGTAGASASGSQVTSAGARTVSATSDVSRSPSRRVGGSTLGAQPARRTPTRPQPRPLPPPGQDEEELIENPFQRRGLHRSPLNTGVLPAVVHEEPELPPTPEHPDPVVSTPPSGIHNTPSKRRRDPSEKEAMRLRSSPSRHPLSKEIAGLPALPQKESQKARGKRGASPVKIVGGTIKLPERSKEKVAPAPAPKPRSEFAPGTHPRRSVRLRGPNWEKVQERDALLEEVERLEADLELAKRENNNAAKGLPLADKDGVLDLLGRYLVPNEEEPGHDASTEWLDTVMDPIAMLGFNGFAAINLPPAIPNERAEENTEPPIISHHPVPMNAAEELPYLQMFTPLIFTSSMATISPAADAPDQTTFQKHSINIRSASPPGLFAARIELVVNTRQKSISSLAVLRLDPAAIGELQPFFDSITSAQADFHPVKTRNVNLVCWAMGEWYKTAIKRAKLWILLETSVQSHDGLLELVRSMRARKKRKHKRQGQADEPDHGGGEGAAADSEDPKLFTKGRLLPYMGRTSIDLKIPYLKMQDQTEVFELRVKWAIDFDWTGEAKNQLGVELGAPGKWQAIDDRRSFVGIPKLFDTLLQGGEEPLIAVKTVVALLAGEPRS